MKVAPANCIPVAFAAAFQIVRMDQGITRARLSDNRA
jgi:hypothetical protein